MQIFFVLDNHGAHEAGCFIDIALDGYTRNHVAELNLAALIGENRHVVRVPLHERLPFLDRRAVVLGNHGAYDHVVALELAALCIVHANGAVLVQNDPASVKRLDRSQIVESDRAIVLRFDDRLLECLAGRAADVEGPHR